MRRLYEWKHMNPPTTSSNSSTKNFPSQVENYNKILAAIRTEKVFNYSPNNINRLSDRILDVDFERNGKKEIGLSIIYRPDGPNYVVIIYDADDNEISKDVCASFEEVIDVLFYEGIIKDKTLCESASELTEWKLMNPPASKSNSNTASKSSSLNYPSQEERYKKLLAQIDKEKQFDTSIITLNDNALVFNLIDPNNKNKITPIAIVYKPYTNPPHWVMAVGKGYGVEYEDWNELLEIFEIPGVIKDISSLKESFESSIVEEFKEFSNMWMTSPQQTESPNDLYIIYCDFDDGSYDILYADSDLKVVKEEFKKEAIDFMIPCNNADQTVNLLHIKLNELSVVDDKEFISLTTYYNTDSWDEREFTLDENKLFSKYEKLFWSDSSFSVLYSFTDVEAYDVAVDQELDPNDMTESEWRKFVEAYIEDSIT